MTDLRIATYALITALGGLGACAHEAELPVTAGTGPDPTLPPPADTLLPTVNIAPAVGWSEGATPEPAAGLLVNAFAAGLDHPRWLHVLPNGDVLVAETNAQPSKPKGLREWIMAQVMEEAGAAVPSADRITLLRDGDGDGVAEQRSVLLDDLTSPFGMQLVGDVLYVANTDALVAFPYREGETEITAEPRKVVDLPAGAPNYHWTKNVIASPDGGRLYVTVGSNSNIAEHGLDKEQHRAAILEVAPESGEWQEFATGLRNPNGMDFHPQTGELWTVVNERDELGSDLVPDYLTSVSQGEFFGWPFSYFGAHVDERVEPQQPELVEQAVVPDYALGAHTASLGLAFYDQALLPERFRNGAFIGQHGSWNREPLSGYKVIFVPFENGQPRGEPSDVLTGFVNEAGDARGRPVGIVVDSQGALLVADDVGNTIWRVTPD